MIQHSNRPEPKQSVADIVFFLVKRTKVVRNVNVVMFF